MTTLPSCDACRERIQGEAHFVGRKLVCLPCWRWIARSKGDAAKPAGTPCQRELVSKQVTTKENSACR